MEEQYNGILVVNKPSGITSRDVVNKVSHILHTKKVGHTGTLDPMATGVLVLTIGKCTKLTNFLTQTHKTYKVSMKLGYETDTLDITGKTVKTSDNKVSNDEISNAINSFKGSYMQEVPVYSAVKIDGKKLYEYARSEKSVELPKRLVEIDEISDIVIGEDISFTVCVSKGTYIRSLVRDIGVKLGTCATMSSLERVKQGIYGIEESYTLEDIESSKYKILGYDEIFSGIKKIECDEVLYKKVSNGVKITNECKDEYLLFTYKNDLISLYKKDGDIYKMYFKM